MTYLTADRDALAKALQDAIEAECPHEADEHAEGTCQVCDLTFALPELLADALIASGAVIDASTLADDEAIFAAIYADAEGVDPHERVMLPRMVADALTEGSQ